MIRPPRHLDPRLGLLNTCILLTSSWLVALATHAGRNGAMAAARLRLWSALGVGGMFAVIKAVEYYVKIRAGITVSTNEFYTFYYALTGVHLFHYLVGLIVLGVLARGAWQVRTADDEKRYLVWLEGGALYWHLVDLLWVFLYAILYLLGGR